MGVVAHDRVTPLCTVEEFWTDLGRYRGQAAEAVHGTMLLDDLTPAVPVPSQTRVICAGLNYRDHAEEADDGTPDQPDVFGRWSSTLTTTGTCVPLPPREAGLDWEGELAAVVGAELRDVTPEEAASGIFAYTCFNDLSARTFQFAGRQMTMGKNADRSGPIGSHLVERDDLDDARDLRITTEVNDVMKQDGSSRDLIFTAAEIIAYVSGCMTLRPGDVVATGTPSGVGFTRNPPELLGDGDTVRVTIEGIGWIENRIGPAGRGRRWVGHEAARGESR